MTFRQMEIFTAVCDCGSITKASEQYFISPQGISRTIKDLEKELNCELLFRSVSGVAVTKTGNYFYGECRRILKQISRLKTNIAQMEELPKETIYIGMSFGMISLVPSGLISSFEALHPGTKINYSDNADLPLENQLARNEFELCITTGIMNRDLFEWEMLCQIPINLCIPYGHELFGHDKIRIEDLDHQHFALLGTQFFIRHKFEAICREAGITPEPGYISNDFNSLLVLAMQNRLLFSIPEPFVKYLGTQCRYVPFPAKDYHMDIYIVRKKQGEFSERANALYHYIVGKMKAE